MECWEIQEYVLIQQENGYDALQLTTDVEYDLAVLLDHQMPGMDGIETFIEMKEIWRKKESICTCYYAFCRTGIRSGKNIAIWDLLVFYINR